MKKIFKSFVPWCVLISALEIYMHQIGQDSFSIILIGLNPLLGSITNSDILVAIMNSGTEIPCNTVAGSISIYWYIGSVITFILYGATIDLVRFKYYRANRGKNKKQSLF